MANKSREFAPGGAFVLGGSGGLGSAVCLAFAHAGVEVTLSYRSDRQAAEDVAERLRATGAAAHTFQLDARDRDAVQTTLALAAEACGGLGSVVYAAGPPFKPQFFGKTSPETWRDWLEGDVLAAIQLAQASIPYLRSSKGAFLALSTYQGDLIEVRGGVSAISKAAVDRMIAVIAKEEGRYGIRANSLRCGWIESETNDRLFIEMPELARTKAKAIPLGRLGKPTEIGEAAVFLCSRQAGFITGQAITADGGESL